MWKSPRHVLGHSKRGVTRHLNPQMLNEYFSNVGKSLTEAYTDSLPPWRLSDCVHAFKSDLTSVECVTKCI